jgi:hypothetical protein
MLLRAVCRGFMFVLCWMDRGAGSRRGAGGERGQEEGRSGEGPGGGQEGRGGRRRAAAGQERAKEGYESRRRARGEQKEGKREGEGIQERSRRRGEGEEGRRTGQALSILEGIYSRGHVGIKRFLPETVGYVTEEELPGALARSGGVYLPSRGASADRPSVLFLLLY